MVPSFVLVKHGHTTVTVAGRCEGVVDVQSLLMLLRENNLEREEEEKGFVFSETISEEADDELGDQPLSNGVFNGESSMSSNSSSVEARSNLLHEQQSAYEASLAKDRAKELDRQDKEALLERQRQIEKEYQLERERLVEESKQLLTDEPQDPTKGIRLAVHLPDGKKISKTFNCDDPTKVLYAFVNIHYLPQPDSLYDYRLQSLHPAFHVPRDGKISDHIHDTQHKLYVDLVPGPCPSSTENETSAGAESDIENSSAC